MKCFVIALAVLILTACGKGGGGSEGRPGEGPKPSPVKGLPKWGELQCQKNLNCETMVLNVPEDSLLDFFRHNFSKSKDELSSAALDYSIFVCGKESEKLWAEFLRDTIGEEMDPGVTADDFLLGVLELSSCSYGSDLRGRINQYFINTKEYKNETNSNE